MKIATLVCGVAFLFSAMSVGAATVTYTVTGWGPHQYPASTPPAPGAPHGPGGYPGDTLELLSYTGTLDLTPGTYTLQINTLKWAIDYTYCGTATDWNVCNPVPFNIAAPRSISFNGGPPVPLGQPALLTVTWDTDYVDFNAGGAASANVNGFSVSVSPLAYSTSGWNLGPQPEEALMATFTVAALPPAPPEPKTACLNLGLFSNIDVLPCVLDMNRVDNGPGLLSDMAVTLSQSLGLANMSSQGQSCGGAVLMSYAGGKLAFLPLYVQSGDPRADGVYPAGVGQWWTNNRYTDGTYTVVSKGTALTVAPGVAHLCELGSLLADWGRLQVNERGTISASHGGVTYVVAPSYQVHTADVGAAKLWLAGDSYWHFSDAEGNSQTLYPAFLEPGRLWSELLLLDPNPDGAALTIQRDATARIKLHGKSYVLTPDLTLGAVPPEHAAGNWWQEGEGRFWLRNRPDADLGIWQGFNVKP